MNSDRRRWEPSQWRGFVAELQANPGLCERVLAVLGEPAPEPERVLIRTDAESINLAIARAIALAVVRREIAQIELAGDGNAHAKV